MTPCVSIVSSNTYTMCFQYKVLSNAFFLHKKNFLFKKFVKLAIMFFFVKRIMKLYPIFIFSAQTLEISGINWNLILQKAWRSHHKTCTLLFLAFLRKTKWKTQYFITIFFSFSNFTLLFSGKSIFQWCDFDELNNGNKKNRKRKLIPYFIAH